MTDAELLAQYFQDRRRLADQRRPVAALHGRRQAGIGGRIGGEPGQVLAAVSDQSLPDVVYLAGAALGFLVFALLQKIAEYQGAEDDERQQDDADGSKDPAFQAKQAAIVLHLAEPGKDGR